VFAAMLCLWLGPAATSATVLPARYAPDRILVHPKSWAVTTDLASLHNDLQTQVLREFKSGVQLVRLPPGASVPHSVQRFRNSGLVRYAEPDYFVHAASTAPNDPGFTNGLLWGLQNTGQYDGESGADIDAIEGWDVQTSASNIVVAILDTGIRVTHEDLVSNLWVNTNDNTYGFNAFTAENDPTDDSGHGTQVAGILGAVGNNAIGITGVAWRIQLMACKCLDETGQGTDSSVIAAFEFAQTNGARIINASFSGSDFSEAVSNSIVSLRDDGIILVAPAGNNWADLDQNPRYPACYDLDNIVSVSASGNDDWPGFKSNTGAENVDLFAPGELIYSTDFQADDAYYPQIYPQLAPYGTSFAAAHVSGALALILETYPGEHYRTSLRRLLLAVDRLPTLEGECVTGGRLNLSRAFQPLIQLDCVGGSENEFHFRVKTSPNRTCIIESSLDLTTWTAIHTNTTSIYGSFEFLDCPLTNATQQFYRAFGAP
jgi:subtilisin family serine protease